MRSFFVALLIDLSLWSSALAWNKRNADIQVDMVEVNHCQVAGQETVAFTQLLIWSWDPAYSRFVCDYWCLLSRPGEFACVAPDKFRFRGRIIRPKIYRETYTQRDPERENRKLMPEESRLSPESLGIDTRYPISNNR
ncbi:MAG: hypothetical protein KatS3mg109_0097 [Pirellulaceae bacterium]|nr:MAG: hypothetical protein KatS3mg109_0097 [Pirellulaceae bacterium]